MPVAVERIVLFKRPGQLLLTSFAISNLGPSPRNVDIVLAQFPIPRKANFEHSFSVRIKTAP